MAVTLTYDSTLARVRIDADDLGDVDHAVVERSTDQVTWTTVRGGAEAEVDSGELADILDDYEFVPGVANYYRVRGVSTDAITYVAAGTASTGADGSRTPAAPAGIVAGDLVVILASTRNSGTGTVDTPTDWTEIASTGNLALLGRVYDGSWTMPTITYTDGAANEDTLARAFAFRNANLEALTSNGQLNASGQNIAYPAVTIGQDSCVVLVAGWKADDWSGVAALSGATEAGETTSTAGSDAGQVLDYVIQTTAADVDAGSFTVTGGGAAISRGLVVALPKAEYLSEQTDSVTPTLTSLWLKSTMRSMLNQTISLGGPPIVVSSTPRATLHEVVDRAVPLSTNQLAGSSLYTLQLRTETEAEAKHLDFLLAAGDVMFLHGPTSDGMPRGWDQGVYLQCTGAVVEQPVRNGGSLRHWLVPVRQVAAPGPDIVTAAATWATITAKYGTWADVEAAYADWPTLVATEVGDPTEVTAE